MGITLNRSTALNALTRLIKNVSIAPATTVCVLIFAGSAAIVNGVSRLLVWLATKINGRSP